MITEKIIFVAFILEYLRQNIPESKYIITTTKPFLNKLRWKNPSS